MNIERGVISGDRWTTYHLQTGLRIGTATLRDSKTIKCTPIAWRDDGTGRNVFLTREHAAQILRIARIKERSRAREHAAQILRIARIKERSRA